MDSLATKMEACWAAIATNEVSTFATRVTGVAVMTFTRPFVVWVLRLFTLLSAYFFVRRLYQCLNKLKHKKGLLKNPAICHSRA